MAATSPSIVQVSLTYLTYSIYICMRISRYLPRTVCNRTYYGDIGRTYAIKVPTPQWNKLPFLCHLTFTASGHDQGDIVQVSRPTHMYTCAMRGKGVLCTYPGKKRGPLRQPRAVAQLDSVVFVQLGCSGPDLACRRPKISWRIGNIKLHSTHTYAHADFYTDTDMCVCLCIRMQTHVVQLQPKVTLVFSPSSTTQRHAQLHREIFLHTVDP